MRYRPFEKSLEIIEVVLNNEIRHSLAASGGAEGSAVLEMISVVASLSEGLEGHLI